MQRILTLTFCLYCLGVFAQNFKPRYKDNGPVNNANNPKYFGMDLNPILGSVLPFNSLNKQSPMTLVFRRYWNNVGYRIGFGVNSEATQPYFSSEIGFDSRKNIDKGKWTYFKGMELGFTIFDQKSQPFSGASFVWTQGGYVSGHLGIEYKIDKYLSVSTEARIGVYTSVGIRTLPPTNFVVHLRL